MYNLKYECYVMTRSAILAVLICCGAGAMAQNAKGQFSVKPMAGVSVSTFSGSATGDVYHSIARPTGGLELEFGATEWLGVSLGISYSQLGAKVDGAKFIPGVISGDGEELDAYVLGVDTPLKTFHGICIAIIQRLSEDDDKLIVVPIGKTFSDEEILEKTAFQEQFFESILIR